MVPPFLLVLLAVTSLASYVLGVKVLGLPASGIRRAIGRMLDSVGLALLFMLANLATGIAAIAVTQVGTGHFVSPYIIADQAEALLVLSFLQGIAFQWWREA